MIIGLSGRIKSGKGYISDRLVDSGFKKITIAGFLKESLSKLYNINIDHFNNQELKKKEFNFSWNKKIARDYSKIISEPFSSVWINGDEQKILKDPREAMQFIGTQVLRRIDPDYHVKKMLSNLDISNNYVCDDVRFKNEKLSLEKFGAKCIFIIRTNQWDFSNHESETSLNWSDFDHVIINNKSLKYIDKKIDSFIDNLRIEEIYSKRIGMSVPHFKESLYKSGSTIEMARKLGCSRDKIVWWANKYLIPIPSNIYKLNNLSFLDVNEESSYFAGLLSADGCIKKNGKSGSFVIELSSIDKSLIDKFNAYIETDKKPYSRIRYNGKKSYYSCVNSVFIVENLKLWNIKPRKSRFNEIPEILLRKENINLIDYWFVGLIDGDGTVNKKLGHISCLASKEIVEWLSDFYRDFNPKVYQEKNIENLYSINFHGSYAVKLAKKLPIHIGLKRKWQYHINLKK